MRCCRLRRRHCIDHAAQRPGQHHRTCLRDHRGLGRICGREDKLGRAGDRGHAHDAKGDRCFDHVCEGLFLHVLTLRAVLAFGRQAGRLSALEPQEAPAPQRARKSQSHRVINLSLPPLKPTRVSLIPIRSNLLRTLQQVASLLQKHIMPLSEPAFCSVAKSCQHFSRHRTMLSQIELNIPPLVNSCRVIDRSSSAHNISFHVRRARGQVDLSPHQLGGCPPTISGMRTTRATIVKRPALRNQ